MVIRSLAVLKKTSRKEETEIEKKQSKFYNKLLTVERRQEVKDWIDEILGLDLVFVS